MAIIKDLIIVHFQEGFFTNENQALKNRAKQEIQKLVNIGLANNDTRIAFWLDKDVKGVASVIPIDLTKKNITEEIAPCGANDDYSLQTNEVLVTGGWFGACIKFSVTSLVTVFLDNERLTNIGTLDVRLKRKAIFDTTELLEKQSKNNIQIDLLASFDETITNAIECQEDNSYPVQVLNSF